MLKKLFKNKTLLILLGIFLIGLVLKLINYWDNQIFAYDQARDAQRMIEIIHGGIKLVGPETDIKGVFNGPLYYYLLAPFYLIFSYDPNLVGLVMILVNLAGIILVYYTSRVTFGKKEIGFIAAFLWAISYEQANFARFISNASFMGVSCLVFFLGLALLIFRKNKWGLPISAIGLGMALNFNLYLGYLIIFYPLLYLIYRPKLNFRYLSLAGLLFLAFISPLIVGELKWNFMSTKAMLAYLNSHQSSSVLSNLSSYPDRISGAVHWGFFSFDDRLGLLLLAGVVIFLLYRFKTNRKPIMFLLIWLFSTLPLFFFKTGVLTAEVSNSSIFGALAIAFGFVIYDLVSSKKLWLVGAAMLVAVIASNLTLFVSNNFLDQNLFSLQSLVLGQEKQIIDYTYTTSTDKKFSVCALTNPLTINTLWSFLYKYYGEKKYGYLPDWSGKKQFLNASYLPYDVNHVNQRYLIIEPPGGFPDFTKWATIYQEDQMSNLIDKKYIGTIQVEKRILAPNKGKPRDTQHLSIDYMRRTVSLLSDDQNYSCYNTY